MDFPKAVTDIANGCAAKHGADCEAATTCAINKVRKLKEYPELVETLVRHAIQNLVYAARHRANVVMRSGAGKYGAAAKVKAHESESLRRVAASMYSYAIAGTVLGNLTGKELPAIAAAEQAIAAGHDFNSQLCLRLAQVVPEDKSVREVVSERKLKSLFKELGGIGANVAAA